jgi:short-subunit dehydrogenase
MIADAGIAVVTGSGHGIGRALRRHMQRFRRRLAGEE